MDKKTERKIDAIKEQMKDRINIAEGQAQLAGHQAKEKAAEIGDNIKETTDHALNVAKEKGTELTNTLKEKIQQSKNRINERMNH